MKGEILTKLCVEKQTEIRDKGEYEKEKRGKRNKRTWQELGAYGES